MRRGLGAGGILLAVWTAAAVAAIEPCGLVTAEEVSAVVGAKVIDVRPADLPQPACLYVLQRGKVYLYRIPGGREGFLAGRKYQDVRAQPIAGLGDDAFWSPSVHTLNILRNGDYVMIQFIGFGAGIDAAKSLAVKVLPRL